MSRRFAHALCACVLLAASASHSAQAQSTIDDWKVDLTVYAWLPSMHGGVSFPGRPGEKSFDLSSSQILDALKMTFMGTIEAKKGKYGVLTDVTYVDLAMSHGASHDFTLGQNAIPVGLNADIAVDTKSTLWTTVGTYNLVSTPDYELDALAGVRLLDITPELTWKFSGTTTGVTRALSGTESVNLQKLDALVGVKGKVNLDAQHTWYLPYYVDIGTGGSKLTWQVNAGVGYHFKWGSMSATWRQVDYQFESSSPIQSQTISGPVVGATWHW
ncbi:MAG: hypothetical protein HXX19_18590 [Rhodoferax sp.]|nr:hypothetical protein [Rhodoferax sp.]